MAVKPQVMAEAAQSIAAAVAQSGPVIISIAAGITIDALQARLGADTAIVRCMPNTPALLGCGASGLYANSNVTDGQRDWAARILTAVGIIDWVPTESDVDAVTARSGSGPGCSLLVSEAMVDHGVAPGTAADRATGLP